MKHLYSILIAAVAATGLATALAAAEPPPAPPAGSPATYLSNRQLSAVMKAAVGNGGDPALSPVGVTDQYFINKVHRAKSAAAVTHPGWTEVHIILEGGGTFVTGGEIKTLADSTKVIEGGVTRSVSKGDVIIVPANTPHWYQKIDGSLDAIEVRFVAPEIAKVSK